ncbi:uncharacterized protein LOC119735902 [Patiria miniata]|uniref:Uncharacterized protein n=1 Tax=Patiria miniata TaxID=46514 RepID=A0A914AQ64_PATMI|nr:uncharacterized protein LOC119735902 [Patiria miniata]
MWMCLCSSLIFFHYTIELVSGGRLTRENLSMEPKSESSAVEDNELAAFKKAAVKAVQEHAELKKNLTSCGGSSKRVRKFAELLKREFTVPSRNCHASVSFQKQLMTSFPIFTSNTRWSKNAG